MVHDHSVGLTVVVNTGVFTRWCHSLPYLTQVPRDRHRRTIEDGKAISRPGKRYPPRNSCRSSQVIGSFEVIS